MLNSLPPISSKLVGVMTCTKGHCSYEYHAELVFSQPFVIATLTIMVVALAILTYMSYKNDNGIVAAAFRPSTCLPSNNWLTEAQIHSQKEYTIMRYKKEMPFSHYVDEMAQDIIADIRNLHQEAMSRYADELVHVAFESDDLILSDVDVNVLYDLRKQDKKRA